MRHDRQTPRNRPVAFANLRRALTVLPPDRSLVYRAEAVVGPLNEAKVVASATESSLVV